MIPETIRDDLRDRLWGAADSLRWSTLPAAERAKHYELWTRDPAIGGRLGHFMDPRKVRVYIKDSLINPTNARGFRFLRRTSGARCRSPIPDRRPNATSSRTGRGCQTEKSSAGATAATGSSYSWLYSSDPRRDRDPRRSAPSFWSRGGPPRSVSAGSSGRRPRAWESRSSRGWSSSAMKKQFLGWYRRTSGQLSAVWDAAVFVPDANILLHCLRHPENVRDQLLRLFGVLRDSLWIPYQVGLEFHRNRLDVEFGSRDEYGRVAVDCTARPRTSPRTVAPAAGPSRDRRRAGTRRLRQVRHGLSGPVARGQGNHPTPAIVPASPISSTTPAPATACASPGSIDSAARCGSCSRRSTTSRHMASTWSASRSASTRPRPPASSSSTSSAPPRTSSVG